ncbi:MAG: 3-phosphoglycerate dehydrogenase [Clostridia bacterium]|nr:3-phosphoglycerate dehydrogenase [Clostridia bacterium]
MIDILKLNAISPKVSEILASDKYNVTDSSSSPEAIILRSFSMHEYEVPASVIAVARAGAGVNNIPLDVMTDKGICVFNTPGANANAVKELVIGAMIIGSRKIVRGINWTQSLGGEDVAKAVEKGKKAFIGQEISGKALGIVGMGAIGRLVADAAIALGMSVIGYDPYLSKDAADAMDSRIAITSDIKDVYSKCDFITLHVPSTPQTKNSINKETIALMKDGVVIINCARGDLVNDSDIIDATASGKVGRYVTDLPNNNIIGKDNIITIPHLGASTPEAEDNCAVMAAHQLKDFIENGNIVNSVNLPCVKAARAGAHRITVLADGASIADITAAIGDKLTGIASATRGNVLYVIADVNSLDCLDAVESLKGVKKVRAF